MHFDPTIHNLILEGLRPMDGFLRDPEVNELSLNADGLIFVERRGIRDRRPVKVSDTDMKMLTRALANAMNQDISKGKRPILDADFFEPAYGKLRLAYVGAPVSAFGNGFMSIRKAAFRTYSLEDMVANDTMAQELADELVKIIEAGDLNIIVAGGTGTGKTTLLNALIQKIPETDRIGTLEDTQELVVPQPDKFQVIAHEELGVPMEALLTASLRHRPDRLIVGELRRAVDAYAAVKVMNTGHAGCMTTLHANSAEDGLVRLENLYAEALPPGVQVPTSSIKNLLSRFIGVAISVQRVGDRRRITQALYVKGLNHENDYAFEPIVAH